MTVRLWRELELVERRWRWEGGGGGKEVEGGGGGKEEEGGWVEYKGWLGCDYIINLEANGI